MSASFEWHRRLAAIVEDLSRALGHEMPAMTEDPDQALTLTLIVDQAVFRLRHAPDRRPHDVLLECQLGSPPNEQALVSVLQANLDLLRTQTGTFGIKPDENVVTFSVLVPLESNDATSLHETMKQMAQLAREWQAGNLFMEQHDGSAALALA